MDFGESGMDSMELIKQYSLASYDVDFESKATVQALLRFMDDIAWEHARELGLGFGQLARQELAWVIARLKIEVEAYPRWGDAMRVKTWAADKDRLFWYRDFEFCTSEGRELARAATASVLIDLKSRRPQRADRMFNRELAPRERAFPENLKKLPSAAGGRERRTEEVRYSDLDQNGHLNNVKYVEWLLDSYPLAFHRENRVRALEVNFLSEGLYGDTVAVHSSTGDRVHRHGIRRLSDNRELFRAAITWLNKRLNPDT